MKCFDLVATRERKWKEWVEDVGVEIIIIKINKNEAKNMNQEKSSKIRHKMVEKVWSTCLKAT